MLTTQQLSVGDNFYDSGVDFTTSGILRFQAAWVDMYSQGVFKKAPWYGFPILV
jgi:tartrate-resistant acid phosphatase type 5